MKKKCKGPCGRNLTLKHFHRNPDSPDGHRNICKKCRGVRDYKPKAKVPFFSVEVLSLIKHHRYKIIHKFGFMYGVLIFLRPQEILAFSPVRYTGKGSKVFEQEKEARFWLYMKMIDAGKATEIGLVKLVDRRVK